MNLETLKRPVSTGNQSADRATVRQHHDQVWSMVAVHIPEQQLCCPSTHCVVHTGLKGSVPAAEGHGYGVIAVEDCQVEGSIAVEVSVCKEEVSGTWVSCGKHPSCG